MLVLTHLDGFKEGKKLSELKKRIKHRFWSDIYDGAKMFSLSGILAGRYPDQEIWNLTRALSVIKFRPLIWRNSHPHFLLDRMQDLTHPLQLQKDMKCSRTISMYGYLRGTNLKLDSKVIKIV